MRTCMHLHLCCGEHNLRLTSWHHHNMKLSWRCGFIYTDCEIWRRHKTAPRPGTRDRPGAGWSPASAATPRCAGARPGRAGSPSPPCPSDWRGHWWSGASLNISIIISTRYTLIEIVDIYPGEGSPSQRSRMFPARGRRGRRWRCRWRWRSCCRGWGRRTRGWRASRTPAQSSASKGCIRIASEGL